MADVLWCLSFGLFHLLSVLPGLAAGRWFRNRGWLDNSSQAVVLGYALGYAWATLAVILVLWQRLPVIALPVVSLTLSALVFYVAKPQPTQHKSESVRDFFGENRWPLVLALSAVVLTLIVILRVGRLEGNVHIFTTLFVNDYFNHLAVTAELARQLPPANIYFAGETAHYYWFFHALPAAFYRLTGPATELRYLLLTIDIFNIAFFFMALNLLLRAIGFGRRVAGLALAILLVGYSYMDLFVIGRELAAWIGVPQWSPMLSGAWEKLEGFSGLSHSFVRDFWVEPHAVAAMVFTFGAIVFHFRKGSTMPALFRGVLVGLLITAATGCDSFAGLILALWIGLDWLIDLARRSRPPGHLVRYAGGIVVMGVIALTYMLGFNMIGGQSGMLRIDPLTGVIVTLPFYLLLDYGPVFLLGLVGWWYLYSGRAQTAQPWHRRLLLMAVIALAIGLLVRHSIEYDILLRKSGKPLQLVFLVGAAAMIGHLKSSGRWMKRIAVTLVVLSLPTLALDLQAFGGFFGARGLVNTVSSGDMKALRWLKHHAEPEAVVQGLPSWQGEYLYEVDPVPALGERRVAVSTYMLSALWGIGAQAAMDRIQLVRKILESDSPYVLRMLPDSMGVKYVYMGPKERSELNLSTGLLSPDPNLFETVYSTPEVTILRYRDSRSANSAEPLTDRPVAEQETVE